FWSSNVLGVLSAERGEAVFLVPRAVLATFAGHARLYYALAVFPSDQPVNAQVNLLPVAAAPFVHLSASFTGADRRVRTNARQGSNSPYTKPGPLTWAGDTVTPIQQPVQLIPSPSANVASPPAAKAAAVTSPAPLRGTEHTGNGSRASTATALADYDDGFDSSFWETAFEALETDSASDPHSDPAPSGPRDGDANADQFEIGDYPESALVANAAVAAALEATDDPEAARFVPAHPTNFTQGRSGHSIDTI